MGPQMRAESGLLNHVHWLLFSAGYPSKSFPTCLIIGFKLSLITLSGALLISASN